MQNRELLTGDDVQRVVSAHRAVLYGTAIRILGCNDAAHDAVQEALIAFWRDPPEHGLERAWLIRAVIHRSLHQRRTQQRRHHWEHEAGAASAAECWICNAQRELELRELRSIVDAAFRALPESYRAAFVMREFEGEDYERIACRLGAPVGTVRSRLHRARGALRAQLERVLIDDDPAAAFPSVPPG